jgi:hypothetical protein
MRRTSSVGRLANEARGIVSMMGVNDMENWFKGALF